MSSYLTYRFNEFFHGGSKIDIPKNALVLDVASGGKPYWRSNVLMDKFVDDDSERDASLVIDRDFVVGDVMKLPFKDKAFDFVIARHILEHLPDPVGFLRELERIARAGYIETPSPICEKIYGWPFHLWEVGSKDGKVTISAIPRESNADLKEIGGWFGRERSLRNFFGTHRKLFFTEFYWQDKIAYDFSGESPIDKQVESSNTHVGSFDLKKHSQKYGIKTKIKIAINRLRRAFSSKAPDFELADLLKCPACGSQVKNEGREIVCQSCNKKFGCQDGIPVML